jgi:hypothetical protein
MLRMKASFLVNLKRENLSHFKRSVMMNPTSGIPERHLHTGLANRRGARKLYKDDCVMGFIGNTTKR